MRTHVNGNWLGGGRTRPYADIVGSRPRPQAAPHSSLALWTTHPRRYLRRGCDDCHRWRPWQRLYEAYPDVAEADQRWWLICGECLAARLSDLVAQLKLRAAS